MRKNGGMHKKISARDKTATTILYVNHKKHAAFPSRKALKQRRCLQVFKNFT